MSHSYSTSPCLPSLVWAHLTVQSLSAIHSQFSHTRTHKRSTNLSSTGNVPGSCSRASLTYTYWLYTHTHIPKHACTCEHTMSCLAETLRGQCYSLTFSFLARGFERNSKRAMVHFIPITVRPFPLHWFPFNWLTYQLHNNITCIGTDLV